MEAALNKHRGMVLTSPPATHTLSILVTDIVTGAAFGFWWPVSSISVGLYENTSGGFVADGDENAFYRDSSAAAVIEFQAACTSNAAFVARFHQRAVEQDDFCPCLLRRCIGCPVIFFRRELSRR